MVLLHDENIVIHILRDDEVACAITELSVVEIIRALAHYWFVCLPDLFTNVDKIHDNASR